MKVIDVPDAATDEARSRDAFLRAALARYTHGISPIALAMAYLDWLSHLCASPGRQLELVAKAQRKWTRLVLYWASGTSAPQPAIEPLPQDRRFDHPDWERWPYNVLQQSFLLAQQWWWNATTGVHGVGRHHENVVTFVTRQLLDIWAPSNFAVTNPAVLRETARTLGLNLVAGARHFAEDLLRRAANRPPPGTEAYEVGRNIAVTPGKVVYRNALIELIQYEPATTQVYAEPVLIVPSWIMKYYVLDLSPGNSLARYLVERGHTVFMISWKNPDADDRDLGMDAYLRQGVLAALAAVEKILPGRRVHAAGYCLGGTLLAIAAAYLAREGERRLETLTLLASELDFSEPGELGLFIDESQIAYLEDIMWARGYLDGKEMAGAFTLLNSRDLVWSRMVYDYLMGRRAPVTDLAAWNADATRMPYRMHTQYLRELYLRNALAEGRFGVDGRVIALADIRQPMFVVATERDHVSPWRSVYKVHLLTDTDVTFVLATGGHNVGIVYPPSAEPEEGRGYRSAFHAADARYVDPDTWPLQAPFTPGSWWPEWSKWLSAASTAGASPPPMGSPEHGLVPLYAAPGRYVLTP